MFLKNYMERNIKANKYDSLQWNIYCLVNLKSISLLAYTTGIINTKKLPVMDKKTNEKYWIPRSEFLDCFLEDIKDSSNIKVLFSSSCDKIELDQDGKVVLSIGSEMDGVPVKKLTPDLLLGCDGINSIVRTWLSETEGKDGKNFDTVALPSAAAGLKYKMLTLQNRCLPLLRNCLTRNVIDDLILHMLFLLSMLISKLWICKLSRHLWYLLWVSSNIILCVLLSLL